MDKSLRIQVLLQAVDKLTRPLRDVVAASKGVNKELGETRRKLKELQRSADELKAFRGLAGDVKTTMRELDAAESKVGALARRMKEAETPTRRLSAEFNRARNDARALKQRYADQVAELDRLRQRLNAAGAAGKGLVAYERDLRGEIARTTGAMREQEERARAIAAQQNRVKQARQFNGRMQRLSGQLAGGGASAVAGGVAIGAPILASARAAMSFESEMANVRKVVNFDNPRQFKQMGADLVALSRELPVPAAGLAQITAEAARFGVARQDLIEFTRDAAKMKVAFDFTDDAQAGQTMAVWRNAFGFRQAQVRALADQINALTNKSGGKASDVAEVVTRVGPLAKVAGMGAAQVAALGQTLVSMGVESEVASTGIKNLLLRLEAGEAATPKQRKAFTALGMDAVAMARMMQDKPSEAIVQILTRLKGLDKYRQTAILTQLVGRESIEPIASLATNLDRVQDALGVVGDRSKYAGSMQKEFANRLATTENEVELARNGAKGMAIAFGQTLLPTIVGLSRWFGRVSGAVAAFAAKHPMLAGVVAHTAAALAILLVLTGALALAIAGLLGPLAMAHLAWVQALPVLKALGPVLGRLPAAIFGVSRAFVGLGLSLLANPVFWVVAAIVAVLVGAVLVIRKYWGPISAFFQGVFAGFAAAIAPVMEALRPLKPVWDAITGAIGAAWGWFMKLLEPVKSTREELAGATAAGRVVGQVLGLMVRALIDPFGLLFDMARRLAPLFAGLGATIGGAISGGIHALLGLLAGMWARIRSLFDGGLAAVAARLLSFSPVGLLIRVFAAVFPFLASLGAKFLSAGAAMVDGLIAGVRNKLGELKSTITAAAASAANWFKARLGIRSPSRVFAALGDNVMAGLGVGLRRGEKHPLEGMARLAGRLAAALAVSTAPIAVAAAPDVPPSVRRPPRPPAPPSGAAALGHARRPADAPRPVTIRLLPAPPAPPGAAPFVPPPRRPPAPPTAPSSVPPARGLPARPAAGVIRPALPPAPRVRPDATAIREQARLPAQPAVGRPIVVREQPPLVRVSLERAGAVRQAIAAGASERRVVSAPGAAAGRPGRAPPAAVAGDTIHITVNPSAGMDEAALARLVVKELEKRESAKAARRRSDLQDLED